MSKRLGDYDQCARLMSSLRRDDIIKVGRAQWRVERNAGVSNYVVKAGSKGRKLFTLTVTSLEPCCIAVQEVWPGSGDVMKDKQPAAIGCATSAPKEFKGPSKGRPSSRRSCEK